MKIKVQPLIKAPKARSFAYLVLFLLSMLWLDSNQYVDIRSYFYYSEVSFNGSKIEDQSKGSAFCLVLKDDNELLAQWVAYHYHVFNMRRLFVAVHPSSSESPSEILERFESNFGLDVTVWNDKDYMPDWWLDRQNIKRKSSLNLIDPVNPFMCGKNATLYDPLPNDRYPAIPYMEPGNEHVEECNDVFRQRYFYSKCGLRVRKRVIKAQKEANSDDTNSSDYKEDFVDIRWTVFTDVHEYIVPNPWIDSYIRNKKDKSLNQYFKTKQLNFDRVDLESMYPENPYAGSLWSFFQEFQNGVYSKQSEKCVMTPRIQFGGVEDENDSNDSTSDTIFGEGNNDTTIVWSHANFDSLRYKYHRDHDYFDSPKGMLNVLNVPGEHFAIKNKRENKNSTVYWWDSFMNPHLNFHYPHQSCERVLNKGKPVWGVTKGNPFFWHQPLAHYRYIGPLKRYLSKDTQLTKPEIRRDRRQATKKYEQTNKTSNYAIGDGNQPLKKRLHSNADQNGRNKNEGWWIKGWLDSFVATHGSEKVYSVLGENYATRTTVFADVQ